MEFKEIKELVKNFGSVVILSEDKPGYIIFPFEKYKELANSKNGSLESHFSKLSSKLSEENESEAIEKLNAEILMLKEEIRKKEENQPFKAEKSDLPKIDQNLEKEPDLL